ncbi:hypothetical protein Y1Q_0006583 [Alligator mississippiensis]|uniref:Uncharacterized protein n=1 Tax=Alligator mississippiensis TaxID=8496 RepID=A0A151NTR7_ALLMI|nr:hypothetical protein Y1Q_0006583 [Alligator mississippiensis]
MQLLPECTSWQLFTLCFVCCSRQYRASFFPSTNPPGSNSCFTVMHLGTAIHSAYLRNNKRLWIIMEGIARVPNP